MQTHDVDCPCCSVPRHAFVQDLEEIEFDRSISHAASVGDIARVKKILEKNPQAVDSDSRGYSALHFASRNGFLDIVLLLIQYGSDPNKQTLASAVTPLHRAAYCGHLDVVKCLLDANACGDLVDADGETAAHKAMKQGHVDVVRLIVEKCPSVLKIKDKHGKNVVLEPQKSENLRKI